MKIGLYRSASLAATGGDRLHIVMSKDELQMLGVDPGIGGTVNLYYMEEGGVDPDVTPGIYLLPEERLLPQFGRPLTLRVPPYAGECRIQWACGRRFSDIDAYPRILVTTVHNAEHRYFVIPFREGRPQIPAGAEPRRRAPPAPAPARQRRPVDMNQLGAALQEMGVPNLPQPLARRKAVQFTLNLPEGQAPDLQIPEEDLQAQLETWIRQGNQLVNLYGGRLMLKVQGNRLNAMVRPRPGHQPINI